MTSPVPKNTSRLHRRRLLHPRQKVSSYEARSPAIAVVFLAYTVVRRQMPLLPAIPDLLELVHGLNVSSSADSPPFPFDLSPFAVVPELGRPRPWPRSSFRVCARACLLLSVAAPWLRPARTHATAPLRLPARPRSRGPACCFSCYCVALLLPVATAAAVELLLAACWHNGPAPRYY